MLFFGILHDFATQSLSSLEWEMKLVAHLVLTEN